jgi:hypothetical protein
MLLTMRVVCCSQQLGSQTVMKQAWEMEEKECVMDFDNESSGISTVALRQSVLHRAHLPGLDLLKEDAHIGLNNGHSHGVEPEADSGTVSETNGDGTGESVNGEGAYQSVLFIDDEDQLARARASSIQDHHYEELPLAYHVRRPTDLDHLAGEPTMPRYVNVAQVGGEGVGASEGNGPPVQKRPVGAKSDPQNSKASEALRSELKAKLKLGSEAQEENGSVDEVSSGLAPGERSTHHKVSDSPSSIVSKAENAAAEDDDETNSASDSARAADHVAAEKMEVESLDGEDHPPSDPEPDYLKRVSFAGVPEVKEIHKNHEKEASPQLPHRHRHSAKLAMTASPVDDYYASVVRADEQLTMMPSFIAAPEPPLAEKSKGETPNPQGNTNAKSSTQPRQSSSPTIATNSGTFSASSQPSSPLSGIPFSPPPPPDLSPEAGVSPRASATLESDTNYINATSRLLDQLKSRQIGFVNPVFQKDQ